MLDLNVKKVHTEIEVKITYANSYILLLLAFQEAEGDEATVVTASCFKIFFNKESRMKNHLGELPSEAAGGTDWEDFSFRHGGSIFKSFIK